MSGVFSKTPAVPVFQVKGTSSDKTSSHMDPNRKQTHNIKVAGSLSSCQICQTQTVNREYLAVFAIVIIIIIERSSSSSSSGNEKECCLYTQ